MTVGHSRAPVRSASYAASGRRIFQLPLRMSRFTQNIDRPRKLFLDKHIVRVIGGDSEDGNISRGQRFDKREQNPGLRERERAFEFQAHPAVRRMHFGWKISRWTDNGEFLAGACCADNSRGRTSARSLLEKSCRRKPGGIPHAMAQGDIHRTGGHAQGIRFRIGPYRLRSSHSRRSRLREPSFVPREGEVPRRSQVVIRRGLFVET
jgi:hypothetical protein